MTITVLPMDATAGAPAYTAQHARQAQASLYGNPTGRVFGTRSGWRVGTLPSVVSVTSSAWTLNPCSCMIEPAAALYQGTYGWASDQVSTGAMTAADSTNPRIDILYIQVNDSSAGDGSGGLSAPVSYLAGTPAPSGTQVAPAMPPRSFLVATIAVPKSGSGSPTITLNQTFFVAAGAPLPIFSQAERDSLSPYKGMQVLRLDITGCPVETWDGSLWRTTTHIEYLGWSQLSSATVAIGPGSPSQFNAAISAGTSFNTGNFSNPASDQVQVAAAGLYIASWHQKYSSNASGWLAIKNGGMSTTYAIANYPSGSGEQSVSTAGVYLPANGIFQFQYYTGGVSINVTHDIRVTRVG